MRDAKRHVYICAVTLDHVQFIGPFTSHVEAGIWGRDNLDNPCWNTVLLLAHDVTMPLELVTP